MTAIVSAYRKRPFALPESMIEVFVPFLKSLGETDSDSAKELREWIDMEDDRVTAVIVEPRGNSKWDPQKVTANQNFWLRIEGKVNGMVSENDAVVVQIERPLAGALGQDPVLNVKADLEAEGRFTVKVSMNLPGFGSMCKIRLWMSLMNTNDGAVTIISKPIEYWFRPC
jgi:hypothetical protein